MKFINISRSGIIRVPSIEWISYQNVGALQSREDRWQEDEGRKYFILYSENIEYKVKWQGYPSSQNTWEPLKNLRNVQNLVDEFEDRNRGRLPSLPLKKEITNGKPASPSQKIDVEETTPKLGIKVEQRKRPLQKEGEKQEKKDREREDKEDEVKRGKSSNTMQTENEDYQDIDLEKDPLNGSLEPEADFLENGNLEKIAQRIIGTIEMRKNTTRIVEVFRMQPESPLTYMTKDASGNQEERSREYMMRNFPTELLDFYEQQIGIVGSRITE